MKKLSAIIVAGAIFALPVTSNAWNIICGISIDAFQKSTMPTKWEADSAAIMGMSHFYSAISHLQSINVESIKDDSEVKKIKLAAESFQASNKSLQKALASANELVGKSGPADDFGRQSMGLWKELGAMNDSFIGAINEGHLPNLHNLHKAIEVTQQMSNVGIRASLVHLKGHELHHTEGGAKASFK